MSRTLLILGSDGMLGCDLLRILAEGHRLVEHTLEQGDIRDLGFLRRLFEEARPDVVVNSAAMTNVDGCESDPDTAYAVNGVGVRNVAVAAGEVGAAVLHVSTDFVFSGDKGEPYLEYDVPGPLSVYGDSKLQGESMLRDHCERFWIVRTQWLYGAGGGNFVDTILRRAREGQPLRIVDDQRGCPTSTLELARTIRRILTEGEGAYGIYHASGGGDATWYDFAKRAAALAGIRGAKIERMSSAELDRPARRPADSRLRNYHMEITLGDRMRPWEEALEEYLA
jgi:dTDP-4-dehydrorhamnose reductase